MLNGEKTSFHKTCLFLLILILFISGCGNGGSGGGGYSPTRYEAPKMEYGVKICSISDMNNADYVTMISNTGSMLPTLSHEDELYFDMVKYVWEIKERDIIDFKTNIPWNLYTGASDRIHRVVETGYDEQGWYAITKGDNAEVDDGKRRMKDIDGRLICKR